MGTNKAYLIIKVLNNNVILGKRESKEEVILIGKGIGFGKKPDNIYIINEDKIEKVFCNFSLAQKEEYIKVIDSIDYRIISICEEIISLAKVTLGTISSHVHVALTDHVGLALERIKSGMVIVNPFLYEIKTLYKEEYEIGKKAQELIQDRLDLHIPDEEVGFIALHIQAARQHQDIRSTVKVTRVVQQSIELIKTQLGHEGDDNCLLYNRLISHLRQSVCRLEKKKQARNPLIDEIKTKLSYSFELGTKVAKLIETEQNISITDDEIGFIALHIERLRDESFVSS